MHKKKFENLLSRNKQKSSIGKALMQLIQVHAKGDKDLSIKIDKHLYELYKR